MKRVILFGIALCAWLACACHAEDSIVVTTAEDIHIVNKGAVDQFVPSPNDGAAQMFAIAAFKC